MKPFGLYTNMPKGARLAIGIFFVLFYTAVGVAFIVCDSLHYLPTWVCIAFGCLLIVYGLWRGYRLYKGMN